MYNGIEHTAIATEDPEGLGQWYERNLEMPIVHHGGTAANCFVARPRMTARCLAHSIRGRCRRDFDAYTRYPPSGGQGRRLR